MTSKVKFKIYPVGRSQYKLRMSIDHQSFTLDYQGSKKEVQWYKKQLNVALKRVLP